MYQFTGYELEVLHMRYGSYGQTSIEWHSFKLFGRNF